MTIETSVIISGPYIGNGTTTSFPRDFSIGDESHTVVIEKVGDVQTEITTGYTQTDVDLPQGTVVFDVAPAVGVEILLTRRTPQLQDTDYSSQGKVSPEQIETDLDDLQRQIQEIQRDVDRSLKSEIGGSSSDLAINAGDVSETATRRFISPEQITDIANNKTAVSTQATAISNNATAIQNAQTAINGLPSSYAPTDAQRNVQSDWLQADNSQDSHIINKPLIYVSTRAELKAASTTNNIGCYLTENGRQGHFTWNASIPVALHQADAQEAFYVAPVTLSDGAWVRNSNPSAGYFVGWFGALGDGVTDDSDAIQAAIDFVSDATPGGKITFGIGIYEITRSLVILSGGVYFAGQGSGYDGGTRIGHPTIIRKQSNVQPLFNWGDGGTQIVRGGGINGIRIDCGGTAFGVKLDDLCSHMNFDNVLIDHPTIGFFNGRSGFSNTFNKCIVRDYSVVGWDLTELCHSNTLLECRTTSGSTATGVADIRIGSVTHCSQINIIGCSFDHWGVTRHIQVFRGRSVNIVGNYFEAKDTNMIYPVDVGATEEVAGCNVTGNRFLGVVGVSEAIRFRRCAGFSVAGNEFVVFDTACIVNSDANNSGVVGANDFNGILPLRQASISNKIHILSGDLVGFYGKAGIAQPTVTGSRGGNVALTSLLTQLDALGLIENSSTI